jgi:putative transposase
VSQYERADLNDVRTQAKQWMWKYNHDRTNVALSRITLKQRVAVAT